MSNARIQFSLASEDVWNAYNPQLKEGEIVTVLKANKKVKLVQGKVGGSTYSESTVIWDEDTAETTMSRTEAAAVTATAQANAASGSASKAAASQAAAATSATNAKASENAAANSETNAKASATAAKNSATSAASSASTASTQAGKAADSATAAAGSATQADTFATTATDKATAADKSATAAAASAVTASDKASEAATSATNAAVSATSAAGAAEEAQGLISKAEYGFLQRNTAYKVGDIAYTTQLPAGYYLECVTAGTTGNTEPSISVESENVNDGTVKWGVKNIQTDVAAIAQGLTELETRVTPILGAVRSVDGISADDNGNVNTIVAKGDKYVRFESGLQICWGSATVQGSRDVTITLPIAFKDANWTLSVLRSSSSDATNIISIWQRGSLTKTSFNVYSDLSNQYTASVWYLAIGFWK